MSASFTVLHIEFSPVAARLAPAFNIAALAVSFVPRAIIVTFSPRTFFIYFMTVAPIPPPCPSITQICLDNRLHFLNYIYYMYNKVLALNKKATKGCDSPSPTFVAFINKFFFKLFTASS
jgi:hypothetical protein